MGETAGIGWTKSTFNPWIGCRRVSPGCAHCYAEKLVNGRMGGDFRVVRRTGEALWKQPLRWEREAARTGEFCPVFSASLSDIFIEEADAWRADLWALIRATPHLTWQILTKRPERVRDHLPEDWGDGYPNVWLGTSGETADHAASRGWTLAQVPARVHFLSAEPWIETQRLGGGVWLKIAELFEWIIIGGESGRGCRPFDLWTASALRDAAVLSDVPVFVKQLGGHPDPRSHEKAVMDGRLWQEFPFGLKVGETPATRVFGEAVPA